MKLSNNDIYIYAIKLTEAFSDESQKLPIKVNFYLQKNKNALIDLATHIEQTRSDIIAQYGIYDSENNGYTFTVENAEKVQKELEDLSNLEQDVNIYTINIDNLPEDLTLTTGQMEAIMFMVE